MNDPGSQTKQTALDALDRPIRVTDAAGNDTQYAYDGNGRDIVDSTGELLNHRTYDSFGNLVAETDPSYSTRYDFTGREVDPEIGRPSAKA